MKKQVSEQGTIPSTAIFVVKLCCNHEANELRNGNPSIGEVQDGKITGEGQPMWVNWNCTVHVRYKQTIDLPSKSPVSATTTVTSFSWSSTLAIFALFGDNSVIFSPIYRPVGRGFQPVPSTYRKQGSAWRHSNWRTHAHYLPQSPRSCWAKSAKKYLLVTISKIFLMLFFSKIFSVTQNIFSKQK